MSSDFIRAIIGGAGRFESEAHEILAPYEGAERSRVATLDRTYSKLNTLNIRQDDLMRQALRCVEQGLFRASHVMAWAAFMDFLEEKLSSDGLVALNRLRPNWKGGSMEEIREYVPERQLVEATLPLKLCTKNQVQALVALLNRRNECAHPSDFFPGINETLGYISELLQRLEQIRGRSVLSGP